MQQTMTRYDMAVQEALENLGPGMYQHDNSGNVEMFPVGFQNALVFTNNPLTGTQYRQYSSNAPSQGRNQIPPASRVTNPAQHAARFVYNGTLRQKLIEERSLTFIDILKSYIPRLQRKDFATEWKIPQFIDEKKGHRRYILQKESPKSLFTKINPLAGAMVLLDNLEKQTPELWDKQPVYELKEGMLIATYYAKPN